MAEKKPKKKLKKAKKVSEKSETIKETKRAVESKRHVMVPKHEILPEGEAEELLKKYNITRGQLPSILVTDPALKGLEVKNGGIIRITRTDQVTGTSHAYRVVISL
jgi:DNA-directed RNA polymerase subunit H